MELSQIAALLQPFLTGDPSKPLGSDVPACRVPHPFRAFCERVGDEQAAVLSSAQLQYISTYINILLRWNSRINLTAVRAPEAIVTRHFGESLFLARHLFPQPASATAAKVTDVGSGAGFPGLPIKIWAPDIHLTLIEANHKKATFLREVARAIILTNVNVFAGRAETFTAADSAVVTLRAVERFEAALPAAARLVAPQGHLALLIGSSQVSCVHELASGFRWNDPLPIPKSAQRVLLLGVREARPQTNP